MIVLETERLRFRRHEPEDLEPFCRLQKDPRLRRYVGGQPRTPEDARRRFRQMSRARSRRLGLWATVLKEDGRYIGYCGVYPHFRPGGPPRGREGALGFTLAPDFWGRGLGTEAARGLVDDAFARLRLSRIVASVDARNAASVHILEKLGFRLRRLERLGRRCLYHLELRNPSEPGGPEKTRVDPDGVCSAPAKAAT